MAAPVQAITVAVDMKRAMGGIVRIVVAPKSKKWCRQRHLTMAASASERDE